MSIYVPALAKSFIGTGAAAMMTQPTAPWVTGMNTSQKFMRAAAGFWKSDPWIRAAERVISGKFSTVDWHLEDDQDTEIDDEYTDPRYRAIWELIEQPQAALPIEDRQVNASTRRELWAITSRHMGVCGSAFWYLDQLEPSTKTPLALLYIAPWRMHPSFTKAGQLTGWVLDWNEDTQTGTPLKLEEVLQFNLEPPDEGAFPPGLIQSAMQLLNLDKMTMAHAADVLSAGGRLAGIVAPKNIESALPDDKFQQLVRDFRTINELPNAAMRTNILQGPIDFTRTAATMGELELIALMTAMRDDILALEGTPYSQLGGSIGTGLNSGDVRKYDEAALWQNAIHLRLVPFQEKIQYGLLDRYKSVGIEVELEIEEPEFDDDGPRYELLKNAVNIPMRAVELRSLVGLEPFGDPVLDNAIFQSTVIAQIGTAPDENGNAVVSPALLGKEGPQAVEAQVTPPLLPPTATTPAAMNTGAKATLPPKSAALHRQLVGLRNRMEREHTKPLKTAIANFLTAQRHDIASRLRTNDPGRLKDPQSWFPKARWDRELTAILERPLTAMAQNVNERIQVVVPVKAAPVGVVDRALARGAARVTAINEKTRAAVQTFIVAGLEQGLSPAALADEIEAGVLLDNGQPAFDELRAETIARTELMDAYNGAALGSYSDAGLSEVQAIDGDGDEECAARDGEVFSIDEADGIEDHPNGTLDWVPIISDDLEVKAAPKAEILLMEQNRDILSALIGQGQRPIHVTNYVTNPEMPDINVTSPDVHVHPAAVTVNLPPPKNKTISRDEQGRITGMKEE